MPTAVRRAGSPRWATVALVIVVACGGDTSPTSPPDETAATTTTSTTQPATPTVATTVPAATTAPTATAAISTTFVNVVDDAGPGRIEISYPRLVHPDAAVADRVNDQIDGAVQALIDKFQEAVVADGPSDGVSSLVVQAAPELLNDDVFSVSGITADLYAASGTGSTGRLGWVFALADGSRLTAADFFVGGDLERLAESARSHLVDALGDSPITAPDGLLPDPANFDAVWLTTTGIGVGFDQYQVADGAAGNPAVLIPFPELADVIDAVGVLAPLQNGATLPEL